jgi:hypothetical protein
VGDAKYVQSCSLKTGRDIDIHRWEHKIQINQEIIEYECMAWFNLAQERDHWWAVVSMEMNLWLL